jgi:lantibiotic modifying enzyme
MLMRLGTDLTLLEQTVLRGASVGQLIAVEGDCGDRHNDGRAVAILTFAGGQRVVYKPKDLRCSSEFLDVVRFLNERARSISLPHRQLICRGAYTWEEYVAQRETRSEVEIVGFFRQYGMQLRLLQLVDGRDFWIDNLRICGDLPVFIDLECILHPRLRIRSRPPTLSGIEPAVYEESVLPTGAVTDPIEVPGAGKQDFGGLSQPGPRQLPIGTLNGYRDRRNGNFWLHDGNFYWYPQIAWPRLMGHPADPADYLDDLESGYREMHIMIREQAQDLLSRAGPLTGLAGAPVRVLMRSTWEYLVLLRASLEPVALLDGNSRELMLAHVVATAPLWVEKQRSIDQFTIAAAELRSLRLLDIPQFQCLPSGSAIILPNQHVVRAVFDGSAYDRLRRRLLDVNVFDIETHIRILRTTVEAMRPVGSTRQQ